VSRSQWYRPSIRRSAKTGFVLRYSSAGVVPVEGHFSTCDVEGLGIENALLKSSFSLEHEGHWLGYTAGL
jgi:hypothetical protein